MCSASAFGHIDEGPLFRVAFIVIFFWMGPLSTHSRKCQPRRNRVVNLVKPKDAKAALSNVLKLTEILSFEPEQYIVEGNMLGVPGREH